MMKKIHTSEKQKADMRGTARPVAETGQENLQEKRRKILDFAVRFSQEVKAREISGMTFAEALSFVEGSSRQYIRKMLNG